MADARPVHELSPHSESDEEPAAKQVDALFKLTAMPADTKISHVQQF